ncbi:hypothetical protein CUC44_04650 [Aeromonas lusitana]|uniref:Uncharacterized protein n=2 Tax=Aeromonas lusitana TaxID=931529 RepID=A0A2M8HDL4_9GAMM|nr:hypothetical protein CUC44_04650 [Aeromonas lusitana]
MLVLTLMCGLALGILGWRSWIYWQQSHQVRIATASSEISQSQVDVSKMEAVPSAARVLSAMQEPAVVILPVSQTAPVVATQPPVETNVPAAEDELAGDEDQNDDSQAFEGMQADEVTPSDEELQPDLQAELAAEQAAAAPPRKPGVLKIETVDLSEPELAALAERKATTAMAKGQMREAQDNYYQVLVHDPHNQDAREQLAALLYGEGRLTEAGQVLEEGLRLDPQQADFRLLLARVAISAGDKPKALDWLTGYQPELASNLDYYATWAGLTQELGQHAQASDLYVKLLRQQPDQGRWWLGLGVAEDGQGHSQRALDAYRNAQLHGNLGAASTNWLEQRIAQLAP